MNIKPIKNIFETLRNDFLIQVEKHNLINDKVFIKLKYLNPLEAIGNPQNQDYPILKGKEKMIEANVRGSIGQAFTDEYANATYTIGDLLTRPIDSNKQRADFIAALNAVYRYLKLCDKTIHCKDFEPRECGEKLLQHVNPKHKVLLIGLQPRLLEFISKRQSIRVIDLDRDNIGTKKFDTLVESEEKTEEAMKWCDSMFVTGSTIVNGTIQKFINQDKPVVFFGVTIAAPAKILNLKTYCPNGR
ncbi:MAG: hypothetical protein HQK50_19040 [Oligoflexia bacterium]|nr:hypothetical protein [Oligoflexia bacterium]MBF0367674.1 hypothetical protein [Oligoflexia bacterium]